MEKTTTIENAQKIMGRNFIGPDQLVKISPYLPAPVGKSTPTIPFALDFLKKIKKDYILILGAPLTINAMREIFGIDPAKSEPCFYNQDWYLKEKFANKITLAPKWYLVKKSVDKKTRGLHPNIIEKKLRNKEHFPLAVLCAFTFFSYYLLHKEILWEKDFIWCSDKDANGDRIYVGRYKDPKGMNKNGFNIHRHLSIKKSYGFSLEIVGQYVSIKKDSASVKKQS